MYYVYLLQSLDGEKHYIGFTNNVERRLSEHNRGENTSTRHWQWKVIYYEAYEDERLARSREVKLKKNSRMRQILMQRFSEND